MKAVILAGGLGTRIMEESHLKPKPMIEIAGKPILWHIMKIYAHYGIEEFIICLGYKGYLVKEYFANYFMHNSDVTIDLRTNEISLSHRQAEPWRVTLVDTGADTMTGGRLKRVRNYIGSDTFCFTYGDGLADINLHKLIAHHRQHKKLATVTNVQPPGRYGVFELESDGMIKSFQEKPAAGGWINGGFFVLEPEAIDYIEDDKTPWEASPMQNLVRDQQMSAYSHHGFWQAMDTLREKTYLENLWNTGKAPWKLWD
jgi:glucose-1-phosphate cytidylyltransferase